MSEKVKPKNDFAKYPVSIFRFWLTNLVVEGVVIGIVFSVIATLILMYNPALDATIINQEAITDIEIQLLIIWAFISIGAMSGAMIGTHTGFLYALFLAIARIQSRKTYIIFSNMLTGIIALILFGCASYFTVSTPVGGSMAAYDVLSSYVLIWSLCLVIVITWRFSRLHRRFVRYYFGEEYSKRKVA